jgi:protein CpxP
MALPMLLRGVELTADQKTQVREIMANHRSSFRELLGQLRSVQNEIENKILSPENVEVADLTAQIQQLSQLQNQLADENLKVTLEIRKLLTPEQLARAAQHKEQLQARWAEMRERFRQKRAEEKNQ